MTTREAEWLLGQTPPYYCVACETRYMFLQTAGPHMRLAKACEGSAV